MRILNFLNSNNDKHKSIRIKTEIGDKFLNVNLDQTYESLDILSLKIFQKDVYRLFDSDYGIIVGRVNAKNVGIPNCRVSVFVPIDEDTVTNPLTLDDIKKIEAAAIYPYETVYDKDAQGKIFNLLPKYSRNRNLNGFPDNEYGIGATPKSPVGTFPEKEEILVNETLVYVYDKYYKYTTITNESGDYILTVPANRNYTVNMSCDITDIGRFSTTPAILKLRGLSSNFFTPDGLKINVDLPLESLPNIDIQNKPITVKPLWSQNTDNTNVGINRLDFELIIGDKIEPFVTVIGNQFSQNGNHYWYYHDSNNFTQYPNGHANNTNDIQLEFKEGHRLAIEVYTIKNTVTEYYANELNNGDSLYDNIYNDYNIDNDISLLVKDKDYIEYQSVDGSAGGAGNFILQLRCNRNKVITDEIGNLISVDDDNVKGIFTSFRGYFYMTDTVGGFASPNGTDRVDRIRLKVPHLFDYKPRILSWVWKHYKFDFGNIYSVAQRLEVEGAGIPAIGSTENEEQTNNQTNILYIGYEQLGTTNTSIKRVNINNSNGGRYKNFYNHLKLVNSNGDVYPAFKNQWMNFSLYFENVLYDTDPFQLVSNYIVAYGRLKGNEGDGQNGLKGAGQKGIQFLANGNYINTDFILVDKTDLIKFYNYEINGIKQHGFRIPRAELKGTYKRSRKELGNVMNQDNGDEYYFLIGRQFNNIIEYLVNSNLI